MTSGNGNRPRPGIESAIDQLIDATTYCHAGRAYAAHLAKISKWFGVPSVALSVLTGVGILALLQQTDAPWAKWAAALLAFLAGLFTALQTYWGFGPELERIRAACVKYHGLEVTLKTMITLANQQGQDLTEAQILRIQEAAADIPEPDIPERYIEHARQIAEAKRSHYLGTTYQQSLVPAQPFTGE